MFYNPEILIANNGRFALIWRVIFDRKLRLQLRNKNVQELDVVQACKDLTKFVPAGNLSHQELTEKMSLYLLVQLFYGIVLVHRSQVAVLFEKIETEAKGLLRVEKKGAKRKRAPADGDEQEAAPKKKKAVAKQKVPAVFDLSDHRSLVAERPPRRITDVPAIERADEDFTVKQPEEGGPQPAQLDWDMEALAGILEQPQPPPQSPTRVNEASIGEPREKVSLALLDLIASPDVARRRSTQIGTQFDLSGMLEYQREMAEPLEPETMPPPPHESSIWKDEFFLEPMPPGEAQALKKRPRRRAGTHLDERVALTHEELQDQIADDSALVRTHTKLLKELQRKQKVPVAAMVHPQPFHLQNLHKSLLPMFDVALKNVHERPIEFAEAMRQGLDDSALHKRRIEFDVVSWSSQALMEDAYDKIPDATAPKLPDADAIAPKVSVGKILLTPQLSEKGRMEAPTEHPEHPEHPFVERPSSAIEVEEGRRHTGATQVDSMPRSPVRPLEPFEPDFDYLRVSPRPPPTPPSPRAPVEPQTAIKADQHADDLLREIQESLVTKGDVRVAKFSRVLQRSRDQKSKAMAARKFFSILCLLKHKKVKVKQDACYGEILIKLRSSDDNQADVEPEPEAEGDTSEGDTEMEEDGEQLP